MNQSTCLMVTPITVRLIMRPLVILTLIVLCWTQKPNGAFTSRHYTHNQHDPIKAIDLTNRGSHQTTLWYDSKTSSFYFSEANSRVLALFDPSTDVQRADDSGTTPLMHAADSLNAEYVRDLLKRGAAINAQDRTGDTALAYAIDGENEGTAEVLLERGADPNISNDYKRTPLLKAASDGNVSLVRLLLKYHAKVDTRDWRGHTALRQAACYADRDHVECVRLLLKYHANVHLEDYDRITALECAQSFHVQATIRLLQKAGATR